MYFKHSMSWIVVTILILVVETKIADIFYPMAKKNSCNLQQGQAYDGHKHSNNIQYVQTHYKVSPDNKSKVAVDASSSQHTSNFRFPSYFRKSPSDILVNKKQDYGNRTINFNATPKLKETVQKSSDNVHKNRSQKLLWLNKRMYKEYNKSILREIGAASWNVNKHLCISVQEGTQALNYVYECRSKDFRNFACVDKDGKLESCNKYISNKEIYILLCMQKKNFAYVVPCNNLTVEGLCFPTPNRKGELIPCDDENRRACYRGGYGLDDCKTDERQGVLYRSLRSVKAKEVDPQNVRCTNCEVDIVMDVYENSTPNIQVFIRPLNGTISP